MNELVEYILKFGNLNKQQLAYITAKATKREIRRDSCFSEAGSIPKEIGFIIKGVMRGYYYDSRGAEVTRCFINEHSLVADYVNFESGSLATEYLQACTDCELLVFSKSDWEEFSVAVNGWDTIRGKMVQMCMFQKSRKGPVISQDATTRYLEFMRNYPALTIRVPLGHIASYLGVTQQSLSRIRKNIR